MDLPEGQVALGGSAIGGGHGQDRPRRDNELPAVHHTRQAGEIHYARVSVELGSRLSDFTVCTTP